VSKAVMEIDLFHALVEGTLANPYVASAVAAWTVVLSAFAAWAVLRRQAAGALVVAVGILVTEAAQFAIARLFYAVTHFEVVRIGFLGAPPAWIAPAVAGAVGVLVWLWSERRRRTGPPSA
jgi:hypothetical protein